MNQDNSFNLFGASKEMLLGRAIQNPNDLFDEIFGKPETTETLPIFGYYVVLVQEGKPALFLGSDQLCQEDDPCFWTAEPKLALREDDLNKASARYYDHFAQKVPLPEGYEPEKVDIGVRPAFLGPKINTKPKEV